MDHLTAFRLKAEATKSAKYGNAGNVRHPWCIKSYEMPKSALDQRSDDAALLERTAAHETGAFERLMRRHNSRLFRVARAILKEDAAAEDAVQEAYLEAFRHAGTFRGDAQVSTWLTRIVINQSLMRLRRQKRDRVVVPFEGKDGPTGADEPVDERSESPAASTLRAELRRLLERRIDELPAAFRTVFVMRDVEEMSVQETADLLGIPQATVRTRLFRARALLRQALARDLDTATVDVFAFAGERCDRIVSAVLGRLRDHGAEGGNGFQERSNEGSRENK